MSKADEIFISLCKRVLNEGTSTKELGNTRPRWKDNQEAHALKIFGVHNVYNIGEEFPALTLRNIYFKSALDEILWIWQKNSNNTKELKSRIWDAWADDNGSIGKAYGYQLGVKHKYPEGEMSQVERILYLLKNDPGSRRMVTNMYNHHDLNEMALAPCAYGMEFNVTYDDGLVLNAVLNQRSQDILVANAWNVAQYAALVCMFAQVSGMKPGIFVHNITDAHIYERHIPMVEMLIQREQYDAPTLYMDPTVTNFQDFTTENVRLENYQHGPELKGIPVAI